MLVPLSVADCMDSAVETIAPEDSVRAVARALAQGDAGALVVCAADEPVGIVTESDVVRAVAAGEAVDETTVRSVMSADLVTVGPEASIEQAAELLSDHGIRRLPVVDDGELVGIVTAAALADFLPRLAERRRRSDADHATGPQLTATNPEMAYDSPDWEFDGAGDEIEVGDVVRFRKRLTDADVRAFAEASGDTNRLHLDEAFAARTRFGRRIAHGVLTTGLVSAALARLPGLTVYLAQDLRFLGPVGVDEAATAVCVVSEALGGEKYRLDVAVYDESGERVVAGDAVVLVDELPEGTESIAPAAER